MSTAEFDAKVRKLAAQYPDSKTAILPALRLAQEENGGWLDTESFERVGEALVADMIAIVGSLDTVMGEVDR